jgi:hypothetical protein
MSPTSKSTFIEVAMPRKRKLFDYSHVETALCLWESFLDIEYANTPRPRTEYFQWLRGNVGSYELRRIMHELAIHAGKMWSKKLTDDEQDVWVFDFEFCPMFLLYAVDWDSEWRDVPKVFKDAWPRMKANEALRERFAA